MTRGTAQARHAELVGEIRAHDHAYYVEARPTLSDREYDKLYQELLDLEKAFPELATPESPSQRVGGAPTESFKRVKHLMPMLSLRKTEGAKHPDEKAEPDWYKRNCAQDENTLAELRNFDATVREHLGRGQVAYVVEPKVDGVSISLHYRQGSLALGVTRGDGTSGDDITANLRTIRAIPLELNLKNPPALLEVRGEAYIAQEDFEALKKKLEAAGEEPFPNARNATAGTLKLLDPRLVAARPVSAVFYAIGACEGVEFASHAEVLESLKRFGLPTQPHWWHCRDMSQVLEIYVKEIVAHYDEEHDLRRRLPYEIDGIVLKVNSLADAALIPKKTRAPGDAIVHKPVHWMKPAETVLNAITVQVGRTGVLTPVAELDPVFVQGSTIARATLHNEDEVRRKDIRIGDTVVIRKAGMVIPEVKEVVKSKRPPGAKGFDLFRHVGGKCPACARPIRRDSRFIAATCKHCRQEIRDPEFDRGYEGAPCPNCAKQIRRDAKYADWLCENIAGCPAQRVRRVDFFAQRKALDIESLGGIVAEKLVERCLVNEPLDLFGLKLKQLAALNLGTDDAPRVFGEKNATKVIEALDQARSAPLARWLFALAIPDIGEKTAYDIARFHENLEAVAHSNLLRDTVELGRLSEQILASSPLSDTNKQKAKPVRDAMRPMWRRLMAEADEVGLRLMDAGFGQPAKGGKNPREAVTPVGPVAAASLLDFFASPVGDAVLQRLRQLGIHPSSDSVSPSRSEQGGLLTGKTFVLTGTLPTLSRAAASNLIRKAGGNTTGSVTKKTDYVLAGENAGSKLDKGRELGITVLNESQFLKMLEVKPSDFQQRQSELF